MEDSLHFHLASRVIWSK